VRISTFPNKLQQIHKQLLLVIEDYLRLSYWSDDYEMDTSYLCFELFRDYYTDPSFYLDRTVIVEEDIWFNYLNYMNDGTYTDVSAKEKKSFKPDGPFVIYKVMKYKAKIIQNQLTFTKRENVDKRLLRQFRKFLIKLYRKQKLPVLNEFWKTFISKNLLPPVDFNSPLLKEDIAFKSFSLNYSAWLFSHEGGIELYNLFVKSEGGNILRIFKDVINNEQEDKELRCYINDYAVHYATQHDELTKDEASSDRSEHNG
jgi:hypothetical protein